MAVVNGVRVSKGFPLVETTIAQIQSALERGEITCRQLVEAYLCRIRTYDKSTGLNSIVVVNPSALQVADGLDEEFQRTGRLRLLHGIPLIIKDNYDTFDLQTAAGSLAMKGSLPPDDAYQVRKLREAGAIILAKSNMAEWAFSPYQTVSSIAGTTRNPYNLEHVPAGSSGGTAAAVAASLGAAGLGTDTGNSIRGPSSHCCLVGIRSTMGLTSRDGIVPLYSRNDIGGPITRTVEDAARILTAIAGYDPHDPITAASIDRVPDNYTQFLDSEGLRGARIAVFRQFTNSPIADPEIISLFEKAIRDIENAGAEVVDSFTIPDFEKLTENIWCDTFRRDLEVYLTSLGKSAPFSSLAEILASGLYLPDNEPRLKRALEAPEPKCLDIYSEPRNIALRGAVLETMNSARVDAFIYPTWSNPPRTIGDFESPTGDNSQRIPPHTGFPGLTVPMGFTHGNLPAGLQFIGRLFSEPNLIRFAYAYEQATRHRRPPIGFAELEL